MISRSDHQYLGLRVLPQEVWILAGRATPLGATPCGDPDCPLHGPEVIAAGVSILTAMQSLERIGSPRASSVPIQVAASPTLIIETPATKRELQRGPGPDWEDIRPLSRLASLVLTADGYLLRLPRSSAEQLNLSSTIGRVPLSF